MLRPYRRATQFAAFAFMFAVPLVNLHEIYAVTGTFYAVNIGRLGIADPVVVLQTVFASRAVSQPLVLSLMFPVFLALLFGRVWCGWMCPYHLLSDGAEWLRRRFRERFLHKSGPEPFPVPAAFRANMFRYSFLLIGTIVTGAIGVPALNYVSAPGVLSAEAMILVRERAISIEFAFIALIFVFELALFPRFWCRLFCPSGAALALIRLPVTLRVRNSAKTGRGPCCKTQECASACPMGLKPYIEGGDLLCTNCGRCVDACRHESGVGSLNFSGFFQ
jgi:ferredoxin-type protein NapH